MTCVWQYFIWSGRLLNLSHLWFLEGLGAICWAIWKARNGVCFEKKILCIILNISFLPCVRFFSSGQTCRRMKDEGVDCCRRL
ncbi:hypothetical protein BRADI_2g36092v3 [Brachypodium distachyon]|uniref:Uncharacterized protein n=1 Tax=Brachypodium distachyon TaxID=15368 RepID=A0A2K2DC31_BRADI|nr:hypothetical protein BRADI_2g36092v3 [Brachypodium distachyon]